MNAKHVISTQQFFDRPILEQLFVVARQLKNQLKSGQVERRLQGQVLASLFYEPSTRTRFSFEAAMQHLGGAVISTEAASHFSSVTKGESLEDTIKVTGGYADVIVLRHPEVGAAERAASVSPVPIINAGDGLGEHPTQALLDIFTINEECGRVDGLKIALIGDLLNGRTIHSLLFLLGLYKNIKIHLLSPSQLQLPPVYKKYLQTNKIEYEQAQDLKGLDASFDVLYVTRVQKERFKSEAEYQTLKNYLVITPTIMKLLGPKTAILHPLPRLGELQAAVDDDPRAAYFRQAKNGLYVRMALLQEMLKGR